MASLQDPNGPRGSTSNAELPTWEREVSVSLATRPSRASSLISTRTRFSTTTFQEDAKSIDLSISGQHFRISRDGSKVTTINQESLPPYPFSPDQESPQNRGHGNSDPGSVIDRRTEPSEDTGESQAPLPDQSSLASPTAYNEIASQSSSEADASFPVLPSGNTEISGNSDDSLSNSLSRLSGVHEKANTLYSMAVRIQRAWRNYVQYRSPSTMPGTPTSSLTRKTDQPRTITQNGSTQINTAAFRQQAATSPQLRRSDAAPVSVPAPAPVPNRSMSIHDKDLPIPNEAKTVHAGDSGMPFATLVTRRPRAANVDRSDLVSMPPRSQNLSLAMIGSSKTPSINQLPNNPHFPAVHGRESAEQLALRKWFTGEGTKRFRDTDSPSQSPAPNDPPEAMDSENDVSNHYTRVIRFIDRDYRRALHTRDKEMAELRERLNEKDIVYRQELRARDFLIEDLKKRLDHLEETTEAEIERARNAVEDLWESRWKDRDFHLRERMQRMESEMQKTMETTIAERESFWSSKYEELQRRLESSEGLSGD